MVGRIVKVVVRGGKMEVSVRTGARDPRKGFDQFKDRVEMEGEITPFTGRKDHVPHWTNEFKGMEVRMPYFSDGVDYVKDGENSHEEKGKTYTFEL